MLERDRVCSWVGAVVEFAEMREQSCAGAAFQRTSPFCGTLCSGALPFDQCRHTLVHVNSE